MYQWGIRVSFSFSSSLLIYDLDSRFPDLKIIVGHLGERIPSDLVRIDTRKLICCYDLSSLDLG